MSLRKKRMSYWSLTAVLSAVVVAGGGYFLLGPAPTDAQICVPEECPTGQPFQTDTVWGFGSNCTEAHDDAKAQAIELAANKCGQAILICNFEFVVVTECFFNSNKGMYQVDGYGIHNCTSCQ